MAPPENISVTLPKDIANELISNLQEKSVKFSSANSLRQAGGGEFTTVILPIALTAVQVTATFLSVYLAARLQKKSSDEGQADALDQAKDEVPKIEIKVGGVHIGEANFTIEHVQEKIGRDLTDD